MVTIEGNINVWLNISYNKIKKHAIAVVNIIHARNYGWGGTCFSTDTLGRRNYRCYGDLVVVFLFFNAVLPWFLMFIGRVTSLRVSSVTSDQ